MKCPNCGGEVSVNDTRCPYCGSLNPEGAAFQGEFRRRRNLNEYLRQKVRSQMRLPLAQRIMNLSIVILSLLLVLSLALGLMWSLFRDRDALGLGRPSDFEAQMETLYTEGRYEELYRYMSRYGIEGEDYPLYMQMCLYHVDYADFVQYSMDCTQSLENGKIPEDFYLEYSLRQAADLFCPDLPAYPETYPENQAALEGYRDEVEAYLFGTLNLTREEAAVLYPSEENDGYLSYEDSEQLMELIKDRLKEAGYVEEQT